MVEVVATWCGPCNDIAPTVKELSERYSDVVFNEVDVDVAPDVVQELGVRGPPTFVFFKNTQRVNELFRPSPVVLEDMVLKYRG